MPLAVPDRALDDGVGSVIHLLTLICIFVLVIVIAMVATRWIVNYQKGASNAANIEVVETYRLTANKYVQIVRIGEKYLAIAIGKDEVNFLTEISPDDLQFKAENTGAMPDFAGLLSKFKNTLGEKGKNDR
ncbi:MAG: flagellar biosynthetic protein FliO [Lachnospiraceae bacterium]|nr:flagellar biosynthetic protein FliO [Lachnospiraceae bacterium]